MSTDLQTRPGTFPLAPPRPVVEPYCAHCGLAVPEGLFEPEAHEQFCCAGCRAAYAIIHECQLDDYYAIRDLTAGVHHPAAGRDGDYGPLDDAAFHARHVTALAGGLCRTRLFLEGVHCAACVWLVERLPRVVPGAIEARVHLTRSTVDLVWDPARVRLSQIARAIDRLGYVPHPAGEELRGEAISRADRKQLTRMAVAGACAGNNMLIALALYAGMFATMSAAHATLFRWASMIVGLVALVWPGSIFFRGAWAALRTRTPHIDVPIALGLAVGGIAGVVNTVLGAGEIYFDSLAMLVFLLLVGRWVQSRQQRRAADSVAMLQSLTPREAARVEGGTVRTVPIEALAAGDVVEVRVGQLVPADGVLVAGRSSFDEALLTGESVPVAVDVGDEAPAGATNLSAPVRIEVRAVGADSRIGRLMRLVEEATHQRTPLVRFADRISGYFTVTVILLAAGTIAWWWPQAGWEAAVQNAVALLIVSCPCALGLATPLTVAVAHGRAARRGILIKAGDALETLARPGRVWLDKTGTLTEGRMTLRAWHGADDVKPLVAALERRASHPLARALADDLTAEVARSAVEACQVEQCEQIHGQGIVGRVDGRQVVVGSAHLAAQRACGGERFQAEAARLAGAGLTPVWIAVDGQVVALAGLGDRLRGAAATTVAALQAAGWKVGILSGDHPAVVAAVAAALQIPADEARGGVSPEEKLAAVRSARDGQTVMMVGDGVNDSAALAAASVGVAVSGGAEASLKAAGVFLSRDPLPALVELTAAARRTLRIIHRNFAISLCYNAAAVSLAATGLINPLIAAVLMPISSLTVVGLAFGSRTFGETR